MPQGSALELRLFVSSTFRDLQAERDALARACFPQARQRFAMAGRMLVEIDLRWGLPVGESEQRIVDLCLAEVRRCRDAFVGILGSRYGYVPEQAPPRPTGIAEADWPERASITEYELRAGLLAGPLPGFRRLYFRADESADEPEQSRLKQFIRARGLPVQLYRSAAELAELMLSDLTAEAAAQTEPKGRTDRPRLQAQVLCEGTLARAALEDDLDKWLRGPSPRLLVTGAAGCGKSTLLAQWWLRVQSAPMPDGGWRRWLPGRTAPTWLHAAHFAGSAAAEGRLGRLLDEMSSQLEPQRLNPDDDVPSLAERVYRWHRQMARICADGARLLLVLDGVDELAFGPSASLHWLPPPFEGLKMVVSLREQGVPQAHALQGWPRLQLPLWPSDLRESALRARLRQFGKTLPDATTSRLAAHAALASPAALSLLADELRLARTPEAMETQAVELAQDPSPPAVAAAMLRRLEDEHGAQDVARICGLLWASRAGLYERELRDLVDPGACWPSWRWSALMQSFRRSVFDRDGRLGLFDDTLRQLVRSRWLAGAGAEAGLRERLVAHFGAELGGEAEPARRTVEEWPWQLWRSGDARALQDCLANPRLAAACWRLEPTTCLAYSRQLVDGLGVEAMSTLARAWATHPGMNVSAAIALAHWCAEQGELTEAERLVDKACQQEAGLSPAAGLSLATLLVRAGRVDAAGRCLRQAASGIGTGATPALQAALQNTRGEWLLASGAAREAAACFDAAAVWLDAAGDHPAAWPSRCNHALALLSVGQCAAARRLLRACIEPLQRFGDLSAQQTAWLGLALADERCGGLTAALRSLSHAEDLARRFGSDAALSQVLAQKARVLELQGDRDAADAAQLERQQRAVGAGMQDDEIDAMLSRVTIRLNLGPRGLAAARVLWLQARDRALALGSLRPDTRSRLQQMAEAVGFEAAGSGSSRLPL